MPLLLLLQVWCMMACIVVGAAVSLPALLGLHSGNLVALFLLLPLLPQTITADVCCCCNCCGYCCRCGA
jgi:hypothetical protein